jgi:hypothetical protein
MQILAKRRRRQIGPLFLAASAVCLQLAHGAPGATESWTVNSGSWATASNWNSGAGPVPGAGDTVDITTDDGTDHVVTYNYTGSAITLNSLTVDNDGVGTNTLSMTGSGTALASTNEYFGDSSSSTLPGYGVVIQSAGSNAVTTALYLGYGAQDEGDYTLSGTGALTAPTEYLGYNGTGSFAQTASTNTTSGTLYLGYGSGSLGAYSLSGAGSLTVAGPAYVGYSGAGTFTQSGGTASLTGTDSNGNGLSIGDQTGGSGTYVLSAGNLIVSSNEQVGNNGTGSFTQSGGVNSVGQNLIVGGPSTSSGVGKYSLSVGTLSVTGYEVVGLGGKGTFTQTSGSNVNSGNLLLGDNTGSAGLYNLTAGVLTNSGTETVGYKGSGTFTQSGGTNSILGGQSLQIGAVSSGTYSLSATGSLSVTGSVYVGGSSSAAGGAGTLTVSGGQLTDSGTLEVWNSSGTKVTISGGTVSASNTVNLATINATGGSANLGAVTGTGTLNVGGATASVTASGLQQSSVTISSPGKLTLTAGGASNAVNSLVIAGNGVLNLTSTQLVINYGSGSDPISTIAGYLTSGYNSGNWNGPGGIDTSAPLTVNGLKYGLGYADGQDGKVAGLSSGQIEVKYTLLGDANLDGFVNGEDFTILAANFNQQVTGWDQGDFNYDGTVNGEDFTMLAANFNQGASGTTTAGDIAALDAFAAANGLALPTSSVPEPASLGVLILGAVGLSVRRRRHH